MATVERITTELVALPDVTQQDIITALLLRANVRATDGRIGLAVQGEAVNDLCPKIFIYSFISLRLENHYPSGPEPCRGLTAIKWSDWQCI